MFTGMAKTYRINRVGRDVDHLEPLGLLVKAQNDSTSLEQCLVFLIVITFDGQNLFSEL